MFFIVLDLASFSIFHHLLLCYFVTFALVSWAVCFVEYYGRKIGVHWKGAVLC